MAFVSVRAEAQGNHPPVACMVEVTAKSVPHKIVRDVLTTDSTIVYRTLVKDAEGNTVFGATQAVARKGMSIL